MLKKLLALCLALVLCCGTALAGAYPDLVLNTTDIDGNPVDNSLILSASVILVNFWEPWCGPCVNEMPYLQKLSQEYADQGLLVVGVYSTVSMKDDAKDLISDNGITYPILCYTSDMDSYQTGYVPTTILVDANGHVLCDEPLVGSRSYDDWVEVITPYLTKGK